MSINQGIDNYVLPSINRKFSSYEAATRAHFEEVGRSFPEDPFKELVIFIGYVRFSLIILNNFNIFQFDGHLNASAFDSAAVMVGIMFCTAAVIIVSITV